MGRNAFFSSQEKLKGWLVLSAAVEEVGQDQLPCTSAPDLFYPDAEDGHALHYVRLAKRACKTCPLLNLCGAYALKYNEEYGVWGGMSPGDRKTIRRNARA